MHEERSWTQMNAGLRAHGHVWIGQVALGMFRQHKESVDPAGGGWLQLCMYFGLRTAALADQL